MVGNAEDEIGDRIAAVRETELLYGPDSLLAVYGDMIVHICRMPHKFKVSTNSLRSLNVRFILLNKESDVTGCCHPLLQQIPLRQLRVLRPTPHVTFQDPRNLKSC